MLQVGDQVVGYGDLWQIRRDARGHLGARHDQYTCEDSTVVVEPSPPLDELVRVEARLDEPEVRVVLPTWHGAVAARGDAERELGVRIGAGLGEHLPNGEIGSRTLDRVVSAD